MNPATSMMVVVTMVGSAAMAQSTPPDHVVIVVEENHSEADVMGNPDAPYINWLAANGCQLVNHFGLVHPSQPNYLHLFSGDDQGVTTNDPVLTPFSTPNLGAGLLSAGRTFVGYSEDLPAVGSLVTTSGQYWRKHNPWSDWQANTPGVNQLLPGTNRPFTDFPTDFSQLPTLCFVVPNQDHDMHDGSIAQADEWLQTNLAAYAAWAMEHNSLLIVTWDEDSFAHRNQIPTIFHGPMVRTGTVDARTTHHDLLRTIEDLYSLPHVPRTSELPGLVGVLTAQPVARTTRFVQGESGYSAATDTWVESAIPGASHAADTILTIDGSPSSQGLIRFDGLFGTGAGQVPPGSTILSAKLTLYTGLTSSDASANAMSVYRLTIPFSQASTWTSLGGGVQIGTETAATPESNFKPRNNDVYVLFDVTSSVSQWLSGSPNNGWAIIPSGTDGWRPASGEAAEARDRPRLDIAYLLPPCDSDFNGDGDVGTDADIEAFFACLGGNCCGTCNPRGSDFNGDGDFGTDADIEAFFRVLGGGDC